MERIKMLCATMSVVLVLGVLSLAHAQLKGLDEPVEEAFDLQDATVQDAIDALFKDTGVNYMIDPRVQGLVTLKVKGLPRKRVLDLICDRVGAEWFVENDVVRIRPKQQPMPQQPQFGPGGVPGFPGGPMPGQPPVGPFPPGAEAPIQPGQMMAAQMQGVEGAVAGRRGAPTVGGVATAEEAEPQEYIWARIPLRFTDAIMVAQMLGGQVITPTGGTLGGGQQGGFGGLGGWGGGLGGFGGLGGWGGGFGGWGGFGGLGGWGGGFGGLGGWGGFGGWGGLGGFGGLGGWGGGFGGLGGFGGRGGWGGRGWRR